jgi:hypothetical protein
MSADIDDGTCETVILHAGHGDEELVVQISAAGGFGGRFLVPQKVHL